MGDLVVDLENARLSLASVAHRIAVLLAGEFDSARTIPGLEWTVGDAVAHVASETRSFARLASGEITPEEMWQTFAPGTEGRPSSERMAVLNAAEIAAFDRSLVSQGGQLAEAAVRDFLTTTEDWPSDRMFRGIEGDLALPTATCVVLFELLMHGSDLARGLGTPWEVSADEARLVLTGLSSLLPGQFDADAGRGTRATIYMRIRGGPQFAIWVHDGRLEVNSRPTEPVDCHISADPVAFLLVSAGRRSQLSGVLRGQLVAWGRRPWLAMQLPRLLQTP
jgi:uncharacterized protein (TIGR03083 family)